MATNTPLQAPVCLLLTALLSACSSHIPPQISQPVEGAPDVAQVHKQINAHLQTKVRWGGIILDTKNKQNSTWLTIIAFALDSDGEPRSSEQSPGRFIAIVDQFLEPAVYAPEREITVVGTVDRSETINIGDYPYQYPVVQVEHYYLWPVRQEPVNSYPPYWWHDPFYPWPYYPYYPHYHPRQLAPQK